MSFIFIFVLLGTWVGLTKAGFLPDMARPNPIWYFIRNTLVHDRKNPQNDYCPIGLVAYQWSDGEGTYDMTCDFPCPANTFATIEVMHTRNFSYLSCQPSLFSPQLDEESRSEQECLKRTGTGSIDNCFPIDKPVIYLYPTQKQDVTVQLDYKGKLIADYPTYDDNLHGWNVTAYPDGHLMNKADRKEYSYLFWEGESREPVNYDLSTGFVVKGSDTRAFLQETLSKMGLTPKEYNEFIVYWYPKMKDNPYNLIHFAGKEYTDTASLSIIPQPDSLLRVFMVYKKVDQPVKLKIQEIKPFNRTGFAVIEWGGSELK